MQPGCLDPHECATTGFPVVCQPCASALATRESCDPDCPVQTPKIGPKWEEMGKNGRKKSVLAPPGKRGKKWPQKGRKLAQKWVKNGHFPILGHFSPFSPVGPKSIFRPFLSHFGPEARFGVCTGQPGSQDWSPKSTLENRKSSNSATF